MIMIFCLLTFPQVVVPNETIPRKYFVPLKSPLYDIKGPPESPLHESFPKRIIRNNWKSSLLFQKNCTFIKNSLPSSPPAQSCLSLEISLKMGCLLLQSLGKVIGTLTFNKLEL